MPIKYYLQSNPITPDPNDQSARVSPISTMHEDDIIQEMLLMGTTVTESDIRAVITLRNQVIINTLKQGHFVNTDLANFKTGISGVFTNSMDSFDSARHSKKANISTGKVLAAEIKTATIEKISSSLPQPVITQFTDYGSGTGDMLSLGGAAEINGQELKFNTTNTNEGIFFIATDGTETRVDTTLIRHTEGLLIFTVPQLTAGDYTLEVRKAYGTTNISIRKSSYGELLTVS